MAPIVAIVRDSFDLLFATPAEATSQCSMTDSDPSGASYHSTDEFEWVRAWQ